MTDTKSNSGLFSSTRQPKKRRGASKTSKTQLLQAFKKSNIDPIDYWQKLIAAAMGDPSSTASSIVAQRLMPAPKSMMPEVEPGLIDERWLELNQTSRLNYITYLAASGRMSPDQATALGRLLIDRANMELDQLTHFDDIGEAVSMGERSKLQYFDKLDQLETMIRQRALDDIEQMKSILTDDQLSDDSASDTNTNTEPDTDTTTETIEDSTDE